MKKIIALAALTLATACTQAGTTAQGQMEGMTCKCCQEMMKEDSDCCCKGMMSGMKDGKGMMCEMMMQEKAEIKKSTAKPKAAPVSGSEHEQHH